MKKKIISLLLVFLLLVGVLPVRANEITGPQLYHAINDIINFVSVNYHFGIEDEELLRAVMKDAATQNGGQLSFDRAMQAIFKELDGYSEYFSPKDYQTLMEITYGSFSGIGITYLSKNGAVLVTEVFVNGPAHKAGILTGDSIVSVDGKPVSQMQEGEVVNAIRGETGTVVEIGILRGDTNLVVPVVRAEVETPEIYSTMLPGENIGYIQLIGFNAFTHEKLKASLDQFKKDGVKKLIIDLRDNPGGVLATVLSCLDLLVPRGKVILNAQYKDEEEVFKSEKSNARKEFELVVLVNENSASASEIFAGAIRDTKTGTVIGTTTYGKGTIQHLLALNTGAGLKLTIGEFFTPAGSPIRNTGVTPDIFVENQVKKVSEEDLHDMNLFETFEIGETDPGVLAIEERLEILGYFTDIPDLSYDEKTAEGLKRFQFMAGIPMTGTADVKTQVALNDVEYESFSYEADEQLKTAIQYLK